jgi:hypothetical protein
MDRSARADIVRWLGDRSVLHLDLLPCWLPHYKHIAESERLAADRAERANLDLRMG